MSLKQQITSDKVVAMKNGNSVEKLLLSTVLGEIDRKSKEPSRKSPELTEDEIIAILKKMKDSCIECKNEEEAKILQKYIPEMFSEEQLETIIGDYVTKEDIQHKKDMGKIMKWLKDTHFGKYDGKLASNIVNKKLV